MIMKSIIVILLLYFQINREFFANGVIVNSAIPGIKHRVQIGQEDRTVYPDRTTLVGSRVELPCNLTIPNVDDSITLVLWYRGENRTPIYSIDARDNPLLEAKHFSSPDVFSPNRAFFDLSKRPALLKIDPIREEDDYDYRCRVDFRWSRTMNTFVRLNVIVPPRKVIIKDERGQPLHDLIGPYDQGSNLRLLCEAEGGKPPPALHWYRGDQMIDESYSNSIDNKTIHNDLLIINLTRNDLNIKYWCQAVNPNFSSPIRTSVSLDINLKPLEISINSLENPLSSGNSVELICTTVGSRPPAHITWFKDNRPLSHSSERTSNVGNLTTSAITYTPSAEDHGVYLSCRAENLRLANSSIEKAIRLNVHYAPQLSLMMGTSTKTGQHISEGDEIFMKCQINANPHILVIQFFFNGTQIDDNIEGVFINNSSLVVKSVRRQHSGRYQCSANNSEGRGDSNELLVNVTYAPVCKSPKRVLGAALGEKVIIVCQVDAEPQDVAFQWTVNNNELLGSYSSYGLESTLTYIPKTKRDFGAVACRAKNAVGVQLEPCIFSVVAADIPSPVSSCLVKNQTSTSMLIDCISGDDGGLPQSFHLELYDSFTLKLITNMSQTNIAEFRLRGLSSGTQYLAVIYSSNSKGRSRSVDLNVPTLALFNRKFVADGPNNDDISALLAVILGLVVVLVLFVMIVIICKIKTKTRRKDNTIRRIDANGEISVDNSKEDLTEIPDSGLKNPDVVPPIDGYSVGFVDRNVDISSDDFHQQIQPINSISSNRVSITTTINTQNIIDFNEKQTGIYPGADQLLCITLTPEPMVNYINSAPEEKTATIQRQRVFPLSTPV